MPDQAFTGWVLPQGGGGLSLVETKLVTASSSTTFSGLDGDTDALYVLQGDLLIGAGGATPIRILVNGDTTVANYTSTAAAAFSTAGGPVTTNVTATPWNLAGTTFFAGSTVAFSIEINAARTSGVTPLARTMQGSVVERNAGNCFRYLPAAAYVSGASNLTSLVIDDAGGASDFSGRISLYKIEI